MDTSWCWILDSGTESDSPSFISQFSNTSQQTLWWPAGSINVCQIKLINLWVFVPYSETITCSWSVLCLNYLWFFKTKWLLSQSSHPIASALFLKASPLPFCDCKQGAFLPSNLSQISLFKSQEFPGEGWRRKGTPVIRSQTQMEVFCCR
jgi:hypothetical protein